MTRHFPWPVYAAMYRAATECRIRVPRGTELTIRVRGDVFLSPNTVFIEDGGLCTIEMSDDSTVHCTTNPKPNFLSKT